MFYLCLLYPYILSTNVVYAKLELLMTIIFQLISFQLVFVFPLPYFMIENKKKISYWYDIIKKKITLFWYQDVYDFNWCLKIVFKENTKVLICIAYMQGELNISSTYRFMMSVCCIEEFDNFFFMWYMCVGGASDLFLCIA